MAIASAEGVGNRRLIDLIRLFKTPEAILSAPARELAQALSVPLNVGQAVVKAGREMSVQEKILDKTEAWGGRLITLWDETYPLRLKAIPDPPALLFIKGADSPLFNYAIAVVGTRAPSDHAGKVAFRMGAELAASGITVVSGMALGIDSIAHNGALQSGGRTLAVLGSGLDVIYPPSNKRLYEQIASQGAILTEHALGVKPDPYHFPRRNRIISGISLGVVVVEAGLKSGALITARLALEQSRELFAVPGPAGSSRNAGTNRLIKDSAAHMVENAQEVIEHLRSQLSPVLNVAVTLALPQLSEIEAKLYNLLENGTLLVDELIQKSGLSAMEVNRLITSMQLKGLLRRYTGGRVGRA
ncbi:MAG: DNA-processing protein DprA [Calditrichota bacterium]